MSSPGPYSIGSNHWPGVSKLIEEAGEVHQVLGKLIATGGKSAHWDGSDLRERLQEELGDLMAACIFVMEANSLDEKTIKSRSADKLALFHRWHVEQADSVPPPSLTKTELAWAEAGATDIGRALQEQKIERNPDGTINNCALACRQPVESCQMCINGACPDRAKFEVLY